MKLLGNLKQFQEFWVKIIMFRGWWKVFKALGILHEDENDQFLGNDQGQGWTERNHSDQNGENDWKFDNWKLNFIQGGI